ncbi:hypothetical protein [Allomuricauda sp. M10]|uniref:hypothetical protein n=1 Tax=Allomuricauda sp. M10 TaxID=2683292 RepID=UPI001D18C8BB|nr:hypothetical protein [Muricauda sp. M10]
MGRMLVLGLICFLSCKAQKDNIKAAGEPMHDLVLVDHDDFSTIADYEVRIIQDQKSLQKFYSKINMTRKPGLPVPMVDFSKDMLILICLGEQQKVVEPLLSKLQETAAGITVSVQLIEKQQIENNTVQSIHYPFYLYKMPIIDKSIDFQKAEN